MVKWSEKETTYLTAVMHEENFVRKFQEKYPDRSESSIRNKLRRMKDVRRPDKDVAYEYIANNILEVKEFIDGQMG